MLVSGRGMLRALFFFSLDWQLEEKNVRIFPWEGDDGRCSG